MSGGMTCEWCAASIEDGEEYEDGGFSYCCEDCMEQDIKANRSTGEPRP